MPLIAKGFCRALVIFLTVSGSVSFSDAASPTAVRVVKSRLGKSLIIYNKETQLKPGIYQLSEMKTKPLEEMDSNAVKDHFISVSFDASLMKQKTTVAGSSVESDVRTLNSNFEYGWNKVNWEWGGFVSYAFNTSGAYDVKTLAVGLLIDKNFSPNDAEADTVFGFRMQAGVGQEDSSTNSKAANVMILQPALYMKWFGLNPNIGLTTELGYQYREAKLDDIKTQTQGALVRLGIANYF